MPPVGFDVADEANAMADRYQAWSAAVDTFRLDVAPPPTREQMARLKDESQALDDRAHYFTAEAIGATLAAIQPDLERIKSVTDDAELQLKRLDDVSAAINLVTSVLSLGTAIAAGDPATILAAANALAAQVTG